MRLRHTILFFIGILILVACQDKKREETVSSVKEWLGKEILFPKNSVFTIRGIDRLTLSRMPPIIRLFPTLIQPDVPLAN